MLGKILFTKPLWIAICLFSLYFINVLWGKFAPVTSTTSFTSNLGGVSEFILLLVASIFFVIAILKAETARASSSSAHNASN